MRGCFEEVTATTPPYLPLYRINEEEKERPTTRVCDRAKSTKKEISTKRSNYRVTKATGTYWEVGICVMLFRVARVGGRGGVFSNIAKKSGEAAPLTETPPLRDFHIFREFRASSCAHHVKIDANEASRPRYDYLLDCATIRAMSFVFLFILPSLNLSLSQRESRLRRRRGFGDARAGAHGIISRSRTQERHQSRRCLRVFNSLQYLSRYSRGRGLTLEEPSGRGGHARRRVRRRPRLD